MGPRGGEGDGHRDRIRETERDGQRLGTEGSDPQPLSLTLSPTLALRPSRKPRLPISMSSTSAESYDSGVKSLSLQKL